MIGCPLISNRRNRDNDFSHFTVLCQCPCAPADYKFLTSHSMKFFNHFPEGTDFTKNPFQCNGHYSPEFTLVPSFVMISCPCWHFITVIFSPAENTACSSQFPCKRICGGDFLKAPRPLPFPPMG